MIAYPGKLYRYFSIDADHSLSNDTLIIGVDGTTFPVTADYQMSVSDRVAVAEPPVETNMTRYWWRAFLGEDQVLPLNCGGNRIYGRLSDTPEAFPLWWSFYLPSATELGIS